MKPIIMSASQESPRKKIQGIQLHRPLQKRLSGLLFLKRTATCMALLVIATIGAYHYSQERLAQELSEKIIRFHVRANSDSQADQDLKLLVRDAVGAYMHRELAGITDAKESRAKIAQDIPAIITAAENAITEQGYDYPVTATLTHTRFPQKTYGSYTFPAGEYEALQLTIGQGKGKNWWCVMYPNMCFSGSVYEVIDEEAGESLKQVLTTEEYEAIMESGDYEVKLKWLSFLNGD